jgi:hypothetical protein
MARAAVAIAIAGLDPAIQGLLVRLKRHVDARVKPGHDEKW